jgi:RNA-binding protein YlmH
MNDSILVHFHPEERPYVERMAEVVRRTADRHEVRVTDFLDPRQSDIVEMLVRRQPDLHVLFAGGHPDAERRRAVIAPDYIPLEPGDANLAVIRITSDDARLAELDHGDYLGALLGLGIKREKIGDLHVSPAGCQCVVAGEMADYVDLNLRQVHRVHVWTERLGIDELEPVLPQTSEQTFTVASLRLDAVAGDVWRLSRNKVLEPIKAGKCRVNWKTEDNPSRLLKEGDTVSLRGFGRFRLERVEGETKRGRLRVTVVKFV